MNMQETNASANVLLKMEGICKEFPGVKALDNVSLGCYNEVCSRPIFRWMSEPRFSIYYMACGLLHPL